MITEMIYLFSGCWSSICQLCWWPESRRDRNAAVLCPIFTDFTTTLVPCQSAKCTTPRGSVWLVRNAQRGYIHLHKNITVTFTYVRKHGILKYNMDGYVSMCVYFDIYIQYICALFCDWKMCVRPLCRSPGSLQGVGQFFPQRQPQLRCIIDIMIWPGGVLVAVTSSSSFPEWMWYFNMF